jgi:hypothetical protein
LIAISSGSSNTGNSEVIDRFASAEACDAALIQLYDKEPKVNSSRWAKCVKATVVRELGTKR